MKLIRPKLFLRELKGIAEQENVRAIEGFFRVLVDELNRRDDEIIKLRRELDELKETDGS